MSELHIILDGEQSPAKILVFGKMCFVMPFIGVIDRGHRPRERGVGVKCPNQEKLLFHTVESNDPLHYLRALKLLSEMGELNDSIVQDCIIATKDAHRLKNFSRTYVFENSDACQRARFFDAQRRVMDFHPSPAAIAKVVDGFTRYLAPLEIAVSSHQSEARDETPLSVAHTEQPGTMSTEADRPCYLPLVCAFEPSAPQATPSGT